MATTDSQQLLERYADNSIIRALVQLVPFGIGSAVDVVLVETVKHIRDDRARAFFDELSSGNIVVDQSLLKDEEFLHRYFATARFALNSLRREKIQMFARLLKSSLRPSGINDVDEYEDFLHSLDELTYREIRALNILDGFSDRPRGNEQNDLQWTNTFWTEFEEQLSRELQISAEEVPDFMNRITRTGCYEMFTGGYLDYTGGKGKLTSTYRRLKGFIQSEQTA